MIYDVDIKLLKTATQFYRVFAHGSVMFHCFTWINVGKY